MNKPQRLPSEFLSILQMEGISLQSEGVADIALKPESAFRAVAALRAAQVGITGGEVWERRDGRFVPTYDIWDVDESDYSSLDKYIQVSLALAERQVKKYLDSQEGVFIILGI